MKYIKSSQAREELFVKLCEVHSQPYNKKLSLDVPTRWNSTHQMLDSFLTYRTVVNTFLQAEKACQVSLTTEEWRDLEHLCSFLQPLHDGMIPSYASVFSN